MSRLIARILLSFLVFPLAGLIYLLTFLFFVEGVRPRYSPYRDEAGFFIAGVFCWGFMAAYWWLLWRKTVRWTGERIGMTLGAVLVVSVIGALLGAAAGNVIGDEFGYFIGTATAPLLWLVATVFIWRESAAERAARLVNAGRDSVVCPTCGYNLTGLHEARCPECGSQFTLDQLFAAQPGRVNVELEG